MSAKRAKGLLDEIIIRRGPATNVTYAGGESRIVKLLTHDNGRHIGTVHEIVMPDGDVPHSHAKDYTRRDCTRIGPLLNVGED